MSTTIFSHAGNHGDASQSHNAVREFLVDWYAATPAAILLPPVGRFLDAWFQATPVSIALRMMSR